jgi:hypothetical protein
MHLAHADAENGARDLLGRVEVEEAVDVGEVAAVELVELGAVGGIVLGTVPPAPLNPLLPLQQTSRLSCRLPSCR